MLLASADLSALCRHFGRLSSARRFFRDKDLRKNSRNLL